MRLDENRTGRRLVDVPLLSATVARHQLGRLDLLHRITRAISERQDLPSIFQVILRNLEDELPIDFGCLCLYDARADAESLVVAAIGARSLEHALEPMMSQQLRVPVDQNGLARCVAGQLVYEPDVNTIAFPFPQRFARAGLNSLVLAPLLVEKRVFGVLVVARRPVNAFSFAYYGQLTEAFDELAARDDVGCLLLGSAIDKVFSAGADINDFKAHAAKPDSGEVREATVTRLQHTVREFPYPTIAVVDGAAVTANLGVNPSLTIAAQAERAMSFWPNKGEADPRPPLAQ